LARPCVVTPHGAGGGDGDRAGRRTGSRLLPNQLSPERCAELRETILESVRRPQTTANWELKRHEQRRTELAKQQEKLLEAHYADAISLDLLKREQRRIREELAVGDERIALCEQSCGSLVQNLDRALALVGHCAEAYEDAGPRLRRLFNQALFMVLFIDDDGTVRGEPAEAFGTMLDSDLTDEIRELLQQVARNNEARAPQGRRALMAPNRSDSWKCRCVRKRSKWWAQRDSNPRHLPCKGSALAS
jgi:hypothetical protein